MPRKYYGGRMQDLPKQVVMFEQIMQSEIPVQLKS